ncbi:TIGR04219 family outer membrane beta-barrel protein [Shewanella maritima]|uniref:TIGR04219 family outer membrane beta-barrel protein n=1 Tax=Shewanella maritima TaxID=2520507 RepID=UPI0037369024
MKKSLIATALIGMLGATSAQAATLVGFKVGGDVWRADTSGTFNDDDGGQQAFNYESSTSGSVWLAVEHPVPILPNLKIRENRLDSKGSMADADFTFNGYDFTGNVTTYNNLNNTDFILYYELLDNDLVELDLGAAYKKMNGSLRVQTEQGRPEDRDVDSGVIMGYASGKAGIPGLGLYAFAELMQGVDETGVHDYSAGLGWEFDGITVDTRIRVGYRDFTFDVSDFSNVTQDMQFKGAFAGLELNF